MTEHSEPRIHGSVLPTEAHAATKRRLLKVTMALGIVMVIVPFLLTMVFIARASGVYGGLRGATHQTSMQQRVNLAVASASVSALVMPIGVLVLALSGLALTDKRRRS